MSESVTATVNPGVEVIAPSGARRDDVLTPDALGFIAALHRRYDAARQVVLRLREDRQARFDLGDRPDFMEATSNRGGDWTAADLPDAFTDRRVELAGSTGRQDLITGLGSAGYLADFSQGLGPAGPDVIDAHANLIDRWRGALAFNDPEAGEIRLAKNPSLLAVRPRSLDMVEPGVLIDGKPVAATFFDAGLYVFHNARAAIEADGALQLYLPRLESHLEARFWNDILGFVEKRLELDAGAVRVSLTLDALSAVFEIDEILFELRDRVTAMTSASASLAHSYAMTLREDPDSTLPDRAHMAAGKGFLASALDLMVQACHRRGVLALGDLSLTTVPETDEGERRLAALGTHIQREAQRGFDGFQISDPEFVATVRSALDKLMSGPNQSDNRREDVRVERRHLLAVPAGPRAEAGLRDDIRFSVKTIEAGMRSKPPNAEEAALAELCVARTWQQVRRESDLEDGQKATRVLLESCLVEELDRIRREVGDETYAEGRFDEAAEAFKSSVTASAWQPLADMLASEEVAGEEAA